LVLIFGVNFALCPRALFFAEVLTPPVHIESPVASWMHDDSRKAPLADSCRVVMERFAHSRRRQR
jgi:hypothetical protein